METQQEQDTLKNDGPNPSPPSGSPEPPDEPTNTALSRRQRMARALLYLLVPVIGACCLLLSANDLLVAILTSGLTLAAFWLGFSLLNPRLVGLELLGLMLAGHFFLPPAAVGWMAGAALAGAVGARLMASYAFEDDMFFLPWLSALAALAFVLALSPPAGLPGALAQAGRALTVMRAQFELLIQVSQRSGQMNGVLRPEDVKWMLAHFGPTMVAVFTGLWVVALWFCGRLARRLLGRLRGHRPALLMFRLHQRYIFLLILGLILEIFSILSRREVFAYVAWPLLTAIAIACFFEGLAVVLFLIAVRRVAAGQRRGSFWPGALVILLLLAFGPAMLMLSVLGLIDVWFDFRKLDRISQQLGL